MTETRMIQACPKCDSPEIWFRKMLGDYRCLACHAVFEQPVERPSRAHVGKITAKIAAQGERQEWYRTKEAARKDGEAESRVHRQTARATRWERKIAEAKARWHAKFDGDMQ